MCVDALVSQKCADQLLLLAALEFLSSLGKIFVPLEKQVMKHTSKNKDVIFSPLHFAQIENECVSALRLRSWQMIIKTLLFF